MADLQNIMLNQQVFFFSIQVESSGTIHDPAAHFTSTGWLLLSNL